MKANWKYVKIGSVCDVQNGFAFDSKLFNSESKGLPLIRIRDIKRGYTETFTTEPCGNDYLVQEGDFLIGMDGEFNIGQWKSEPALLNQRVCKLMPSSKVLPKFIYYYIPKALKDIEDKTAYTTVKHLSSKQIKDITIPDLPLPEQQRIVDILDHKFCRIDALKANAEKTLLSAKDLFQAALKKELEPKDGWKTMRITEIASLKAGKFVSAKDIFDVPNDEMYPCYGGNGFRGYVKKYNHEGTYNIIGRQGALCGNINIATDKFYATEHAVVVSPIIPIVFKFLYYSLCNANINKYATGAAQPGISVQNVNEKLYLDIPSLAKQEQVATTLDLLKQKTDDMYANAQKTLTLCDDLKQALLRKAFNGEL